MPNPQLVACPQCGAELRLPTNTAREGWHCSECGTAIAGQTKHAAPEQTQSPEQEKSTTDDGDETYRIAPASLPPRRKKRKKKQSSLVEPVGLADLEKAKRKARQRAVEIDRPPNRVFFSNVFGFPFQGSVIGQWLIVAGGFTAFALIALLVVSLYLGAAGVASAVLAFIVLPAFWIGLWIFSYATACAFIVVQETGAGNNEIREWMEGTWKDWASDLFCVGYIACLPLAIAWPIVQLTGYSYSQAAIPLAILEFLCFPVALLSALEQDSIWMPVSPPILKSLFKVIDGWFVFYVVSSLLFVACGAMSYFAVSSASILMAFGIGPVFSAAMFIYARLIGRLGWLILQRIPKEDRIVHDRPSIPDEVI
ncbi:MAG: hypothetical protein AB8G99_21025 [Planctomycetaceae bacterium]